MGLFGIILRNVELPKRDKEKIHELIKHSEFNLKSKQDEKTKKEKQDDSKKVK